MVLTKQQTHRQHQLRRRRAQLVKKGKDLERILSLLTPHPPSRLSSLQDQYQPLVPLRLSTIKGNLQSGGCELASTGLAMAPATAEKGEVQAIMCQVDWSSIPPACLPSEGNEQKRLLKYLVQAEASSDDRGGSSNLHHHHHHPAVADWKELMQMSL
jgi:hypothetical protein